MGRFSHIGRNFRICGYELNTLELLAKLTKLPYFIFILLFRFDLPFDPLRGSRCRVGSDLLQKSVSAGLSFFVRIEPDR